MKNCIGQQRISYTKGPLYRTLAKKESSWEEEFTESTSQVANFADWHSHYSPSRKKKIQNLQQESLIKAGTWELRH